MQKKNEVLWLLAVLRYDGVFLSCPEACQAIVDSGALQRGGKLSRKSQLKTSKSVIKTPALKSVWEPVHNTTSQIAVQYVRTHAGTSIRRESCWIYLRRIRGCVQVQVRPDRIKYHIQE